jgi:hypothetical protein
MASRVVIVGGAGLGVVLGWLAGRTTVVSQTPAMTIPLVTLGVLSVVGPTTILFGWLGIAGYLIGVVASFTVSRAWYGSLDKRARRKA